MAYMQPNSPTSQARCCSQAPSPHLDVKYSCLCAISQNYLVRVMFIRWDGEGTIKAHMQPHGTNQVFHSCRDETDHSTLLLLLLYGGRGKSAADCSAWQTSCWLFEHWCYCCRLWAPSSCGLDGTAAILAA